MLRGLFEVSGGQPKLLFGRLGRGELPGKELNKIILSPEHTNLPALGQHPAGRPVPDHVSDKQPNPNSQRLLRHLSKLAN